ncbi:hypothetical protein BHM03_00017911, partial [Ensete ventricosum]
KQDTLLPFKPILAISPSDGQRPHVAPDQSVATAGTPLAIRNNPVQLAVVATLKFEDEIGSNGGGRGRRGRRRCVRGPHRPVRRRRLPIGRSRRPPPSDERQIESERSKPRKGKGGRYPRRGVSPVRDEVDRAVHWLPAAEGRGLGRRNTTAKKRRRGIEKERNNRFGNSLNGKKEREEKVITAILDLVGVDGTSKEKARSCCYDAEEKEERHDARGSVLFENVRDMKVTTRRVVFLWGTRSRWNGFPL